MQYITKCQKIKDFTIMKIEDVASQSKLYWSITELRKKHSITLNLT